MKSGLVGQLAARKEEVLRVKTELESLFACKLDTVANDKELKDRYDAALKSVDATATSLSGTMKSVKAAIESRCKNLPC